MEQVTLKLKHLLLPIVLFICLSRFSVSFDFGGCPDVCFLLNIIKLDGTSLVVLKVHFPVGTVDGSKHLHMNERRGH